MKKFWSKMWDGLTGIIQFAKGEKSFYKYTKQTILYLLYTTLKTCLFFTFISLILYIYAPINKEYLPYIFAIILGCISGIIVIVMIWVHLFYIHIKKDIAPLQSEQHQIIKQMLTQVEGDSDSGMKVVNMIKALNLKGEQTDELQGENQNGE